MELLIKEILERLNDVLVDLKEVKKEQHNLSIDKVTITRDIRDVINKVNDLEKIVTNNSNQLKNIAIKEHEVNGFVKYAKLIWTILSVVAGYLLTRITWK